MSDQKIYGLHTANAILKNNPLNVKNIWLQEGKKSEDLTQILALADENQINVERASKQALEGMVGAVNHQGCVLQCQEAKPLNENDLLQIINDKKEASLLIILDGVQDPQNLGAIFRTADAVGATAIIAPKDKAVGLTPTVRKVASGAVETVPFVQVTNLVRVLKKLKDSGFWFVGLTDKADVSLYDTDLKGSIGIILGAEGKGLRQLTVSHCDFLVNIPMKGSVSSLNVSVAAGVCMYEALRQRD